MEEGSEGVGWGWGRVEDKRVRGVSEKVYFFFFNDTATTEIYTLSLHDALPILHHEGDRVFQGC